MQNFAIPVLEEGKLPSLRFEQLDNGDFEVIAYKRKRNPETRRLCEVYSIPVGIVKYQSNGDIHFNAEFIAANPWIRKYLACRRGTSAVLIKKSGDKLKAEGKLRSLLQDEFKRNGPAFESLTDPERVQLLRRMPGRALHAGASWLLARAADDLIIPSRLIGQFRDENNSCKAAAQIFSAALFLAVTGDKDLNNLPGFVQSTLMPEELTPQDIHELLTEEGNDESFTFFFDDMYDLWQDHHWQNVRADPPEQVLFAVDSSIGTAPGEKTQSAVQLYSMDDGSPLGCSLCSGAKPSYKEIASTLSPMVYFSLNGQILLVTALCQRDGSKQSTGGISVRAEMQAARSEGLSVIFKYEPDGKDKDPWLDAEIEKHLSKLALISSYKKKLKLRALSIPLQGAEPDGSMYLHLYLNLQEQNPEQRFKGVTVLISDCIEDSLSAYRFLQDREMLCQEFAAPAGWLQLNAEPADDETYFTCRVYLQYLAAALLLSVQICNEDNSLTARQVLQKLHNLMAYEYEGIGFTFDAPDAEQRRLLQEQRVVPPDSAAVLQREDLRLFRAVY